MSVGKQLTEQLRLLSKDSSGGVILEDGSRVVAAQAEGLQAQLTFGDLDRYSVTLHTLNLQLGALPAEDVRAYLSARAAEAARQLSYLEEPLAVWELDCGEAVAQLRSSPPQRDEAELSYWEVQLRAGDALGAQITRYRWAPGMVEREVVAYPATFALVARICDSLAATLRTE